MKWNNVTLGMHQVLAWIGVLRGTESDTRGLSLDLNPSTIVLRPNQNLAVTARLTNKGTRPLTLVLPGDGSRMGKRTPVIEWRFEPGGRVPGYEGCGNINSLKHGEVFTLQPGETREVREWVAPLALPDTRCFRAAMLYVNDPDLPFRGVLLDPHDEGELARLRRSDRCRVTSNEVEIRIEGDPVPPKCW